MNTTPLSSSREAVAGIADEAPERMVDNPDEEREGIESQMSTGKGSSGEAGSPVFGQEGSGLEASITVSKTQRDIVNSHCRRAVCVQNE